MQQLIQTETQSSLFASIPGLHHGFTGKETTREEMAALDRQVAVAKQVHKADLIWLDAYERRAREADAVATFTPGLPIGVSSADCVPVLCVALDASTNHVYAAFAAHGGWRSTALGIAGSAFRELVKATRARHPGRKTGFLAAIGPCISFESFEVHEDVLNAFPGAAGLGLARFLRTADDGRAKYLVDLPGINRRQLEEAARETGADLRIDTLGLCTVKLVDRFPSYRRESSNAGRILSFLQF
jgi:YfiH family protein